MSEMADSKPVDPDEPSSNPTLLQLHCGICSTVVDKPKVLPCLHTYCLRCISSWAETAAKKDHKTISCPDCHAEFPLPDGGVSCLEQGVIIPPCQESDSFVGKSENSGSLQEDAKISCTSCEDQDLAVGHCAECGDFLCSVCFESHKRLRKFKTHNVNLELKGMLSPTITSPPKYGMCPKHHGEALKFYCETCEQPICRDCSVIEHPSLGHNQVDFDKAVQKRKTHLEALYRDSEDIPKALDAALSEDEKLISVLDSNVELVIETYKKTEKVAEGEFMQRMQKFQDAKKTEIESHKQTLQNQKSRVCAALEMSREVLERGIDADIGMMYAPLLKAMESLGTLKPTPLHHSISDVDFVPNIDLDNSLGTLSSYNHWGLTRSITSHWVSMHPKTVAYIKNGDLVVANNTGHHVSDGDMCIIGDDGLLKTSFDTKVTADRPTSYSGYLYQFFRPNANPWGVTVGIDGSIFVSDESNFIKVYDENGRLLRKFESVCEYRGSRELRGLVSDSKGMLYVGHAAGHITTAFENGGELLSFNSKDNISPNFIAVTPEGHLIYSGSKVKGDSESSRVVIHKNNPNDSRSFMGREYTFYPPPHVNADKFKPTGICVHEGHQVIFVANAGEAPGVYCYSLDGDYLGIVTTEVTSPQGIALRADERELAVCDEKGIKLFHP